jgi:hypothetical protein
MFELRLNEPQNFAKYRQGAIDAVRIQAYTSLEAVPYLSKRFLLKRYLDLSEEEMQENQEMWEQENMTADEIESTQANLRAVGVTNAGIQQDIDNLPPTDAEAGLEAGAEGVAGADISASSAAPSPVGSVAPSAPPAAET